MKETQGFETSGGSVLCEERRGNARYLLLKIELDTLERYLIAVKDGEEALAVIAKEYGDAMRLFETAVKAELSAIQLEDWAEDIRHERALLFR